MPTNGIITFHGIFIPHLHHIHSCRQDNADWTATTSSNGCNKQHPPLDIKVWLTVLHVVVPQTVVSVSWSHSKVKWLTNGTSLHDPLVLPSTRGESHPCRSSVSGLTTISWTPVTIICESKWLVQADHKPYPTDLSVISLQQMAVNLAVDRQVFWIWVPGDFNQPCNKLTDTQVKLTSSMTQYIPDIPADDVTCRALIKQQSISSYGVLLSWWTAITTN